MDCLWRHCAAVLGGKGGRPSFDPVLMLKILVLQALCLVSDEGTEFQIKERLSFQRFLGVRLDGTVPGCNDGLAVSEAPGEGQGG